MAPELKSSRELTDLIGFWLFGICWGKIRGWSGGRRQRWKEEIYSSTKKDDDLGFCLLLAEPSTYRPRKPLFSDFFVKVHSNNWNKLFKSWKIEIQN